MARAPYTINFRFVGNSQTGKATRDVSVQKSRDSKGRFTKVQEMLNTIVDDIAINAADRTYRSARSSLERSVKAVVAKEIAQMARMIGRFSVQPGSAFGPTGIIRAADLNVSDQAKSLWKDPRSVQEYNLSNSDAKWGSRTNRYMKWKKAKGYSSDWWKMTGALQKALSSASLYQDLGPVSVSFIKTGNGLTGKSVKQTITGRKGNVSKTYQVGRLEVQAMSRITPDMLPAIMDRLNQATPHGSKFIPSLFTSLDKKTRGKLLKFGQSGYRPVVEPFLAYYLTRAIPNAVFNRTEKLISDIGSGRAQTQGKGNTNMGGLFN